MECNKNAIAGQLFENYGTVCSRNPKFLARMKL